MWEPLSTCLHIPILTLHFVYHTLKLENLKPLWTADKHSSSTGGLKENEYKLKILFIVCMIKIISFVVGD